MGLLFCTENNIIVQARKPVAVSHTCYVYKSAVKSFAITSWLTIINYDSSSNVVMQNKKIKHQKVEVSSLHFLQKVPSLYFVLNTI